jgi:hypothetical protein
MSAGQPQHCFVEQQQQRCMVEQQQPIVRQSQLAVQHVSMTS